MIARDTNDEPWGCCIRAVVIIERNDNVVKHRMKLSRYILGQCDAQLLLYSVEDGRDFRMGTSLDASVKVRPRERPVPMQ